MHVAAYSGLLVAQRCSAAARLVTADVQAPAAPAARIMAAAVASARMTYLPFVARTAAGSPQCRV